MYNALRHDLPCYQQQLSVCWTRWPGDWVPPYTVAVIGAIPLNRRCLLRHRALIMPASKTAHMFLLNNGRTDEQAWTGTAWSTLMATAGRHGNFHCPWHAAVSIQGRPLSAAIRSRPHLHNDVRASPVNQVFPPQRNSVCHWQSGPPAPSVRPIVISNRITATRA